MVFTFFVDTLILNISIDRAEMFLKLGFTQGMVRVGLRGWKKVEVNLLEL